MQAHPSPKPATRSSLAIVLVHSNAGGDEETQRFERVAVHSIATDDALPDTLPASPPPDSAVIAIARASVREHGVRELRVSLEAVGRSTPR